MKKQTLRRILQYGILYVLLHVFAFCYLQVACQSENALQRMPGVRVSISEIEDSSDLQLSLLQNSYTIPCGGILQPETTPDIIPVYADNTTCLLYLVWDKLLSDKTR